MKNLFSMSVVYRKEITNINLMAAASLAEKCLLYGNSLDSGIKGSLTSLI